MQQRSSGSKNLPVGDVEKMLIYVCAKCSEEFNTTALLHDHIDKLHEELGSFAELKMWIISDTRAECLVCGAHTNQPALRVLQSHHMQHLQYKSFKCKCHGYGFHNKPAALTHLNYQYKAETVLQLKSKEARTARLSSSDIEDSKISYRVSDSENENEGYSNVTLNWLRLNQNKEAEANIRYMCSECGQDCDNEKRWKGHCNTEHGFKTLEGLNMVRLTDSSVQCKECEYIITGTCNNYKLRRHKLTHSIHRVFHCRICDYAKKRKDELLAHLNDEHSSKADANDQEGKLSKNVKKRGRPARKPVRSDCSDSNSDTISVVEQKVFQLCKSTEAEDSIRYMCSECGQDCDNEERWKQHCNNEHGFETLEGLNMVRLSDSSVQCKECDFIITGNCKNFKLRRHKLTHSVHKVFRCRICNFANKRKDELMIHLNAKHNLKTTITTRQRKKPKRPKTTKSEHKCSEENNSDDSESDRNSSIEQEAYKSFTAGEDNIKYVCPECGQDCDNENDWKEHCNNEHGYEKLEGLNMVHLSDSSMQCKQCNAIIKGRIINYKLRRHKLTHSLYRSFHCRFCDFAKKRKDELMTHLNIHHKNELDSKDGLMEPTIPLMKTSPAYKSTPCDSSSISSDEEMLTEPSMETEDSIKYVCPECGRDCDNENNWKEHCNNEHGFETLEGLNMVRLPDSNTQCRECNITLAARGNIFKLRRHKLTHSLYRSFHCRHCDYALKRKEELIKHLNVKHKLDARTKDRTLEQPKRMKIEKPRRLPPTRKPVEQKEIQQLSGAESSIKYVCSECGQDCDNEEHWKEHCNSEHGFETLKGLNMKYLSDNSVQCKQCNYVIVGKCNNFKLRRHKLTHSLHKVFRCRICNLAKKRKDELMTHLIDVHQLEAKVDQ